MEDQEPNAGTRMLTTPACARSSPMARPAAGKGAVAQRVRPGDPGAAYRCWRQRDRKVYPRTSGEVLAWATVGSIGVVAALQGRATRCRPHFTGACGSGVDGGCGAIRDRHVLLPDLGTTRFSAIESDTATVALSAVRQDIVPRARAELVMRTPEPMAGVTADAWESFWIRSSLG